MEGGEESDAASDLSSLRKGLGKMKSTCTGTRGFLVLVCAGDQGVVPCLFALEIILSHADGLDGAGAVPWQRLFLDVALWMGKMMMCTAPFKCAAGQQGVACVLESCVDAGLYALENVLLDAERSGRRQRFADDIMRTAQALALLHRVLSLRPETSGAAHAVRVTFDTFAEKYAHHVATKWLLTGVCTGHAVCADTVSFVCAMSASRSQGTQLEPVVEASVLSAAAVLSREIAKSNVPVGTVDVAGLVGDILAGGEGGSPATPSQGRGRSMMAKLLMRQARNLFPEDCDADCNEFVRLKRARLACVAEHEKH